MVKFYNLFDGESAQYLLGVYKNMYQVSEQLFTLFTRCKFTFTVS